MKCSIRTTTAFSTQGVTGIEKPHAFVVGSENAHDSTSMCVVSHFIYQNNIHTDCSKDMGFCVRVSGSNTLVKNNLFSGSSTAGNKSILHVAGGARHAEITGNQFYDFESSDAGDVVTAIRIDVPAKPDVAGYSGEQVKLSIKDNIIHNRGKLSGNKGTNNGILIMAYSMGHGTPVTVSGTITGNDISLINMNFGILARQDMFGHPAVAEQPAKYMNWEWSELVCQNNTVQSRYNGDEVCSPQGNNASVDHTLVTYSGQSNYPLVSKYWMTAGYVNQAVYWGIWFST